MNRAVHIKLVLMRTTINLVVSTCIKIANATIASCRTMIRIGCIIMTLLQIIYVVVITSMDPNTVTKEAKEDPSIRKREKDINVKNIVVRIANHNMNVSLCEILKTLFIDNIPHNEKDN